MPTKGATSNHGTAVCSEKEHAHYYSVSLPLQLRYLNRQVLNRLMFNKVPGP